jgi:hypothetical protein
MATRARNRLVLSSRLVEPISMTGASTLEVQTGSSVVCSTENSIVRTDAGAKAPVVCIAGNLSIQKSKKQAEAECVDSSADPQHMNVIEKCELTTYTRSS